LSASLGEAGVLTAGGGLEFGERDVAAGLQYTFDELIG
jgi:hypothetical protein